MLVSSLYNSLIVPRSWASWLERSKRSTRSKQRSPTCHLGCIDAKESKRHGSLVKLTCLALGTNFIFYKSLQRFHVFCHAKKSKRIPYHVLTIFGDAIHYHAITVWELCLAKGSQFPSGDEGRGQEVLEATDSMSWWPAKAGRCREGANSKTQLQPDCLLYNWSIDQHVVPVSVWWNVWGGWDFEDGGEMRACPWVFSESKGRWCVLRVLQSSLLAFCGEHSFPVGSP